jgi:hypothetical protein
MTRELHPDQENELLNDLREELERDEEDRIAEDREIEMAGVEGERGADQSVELREFYARLKR